MLMTDLGGPVMLKQMAGGAEASSRPHGTAWSTATEMATAVQGAFNAVIAANPIGAIAVAVAAVVARARMVLHPDRGRAQGMGRVHLMAVRDMGRASWRALRRYGTRLGEFLANLWSAISGITSAWTSDHLVPVRRLERHQHDRPTIFNGIRDFIVNVFTVIGALIVAPLQAMIQNGINTVFGWILSFITQQMNSTNTVWSTVWTAIYNVVSTIFGLISSCISTVVNAIRTVIVVFLSFLKGDWQGRMGRDQIVLHDHMGRHRRVPHADHQRHQDHDRQRPQRDPERVGRASGTRSAAWCPPSGTRSAAWCPHYPECAIPSSTVLNAISGVWILSVYGTASLFLRNIWHGITSAVSNGIQSVSNTVGRIKSTVLRRGQRRRPMAVRHRPSVIQGPHINGIGGASKWVMATIGNLGKTSSVGPRGARHPQPVTHLPRRSGQMDTRRHGPKTLKRQGPRRRQHDRSDMVPTVSFLKTDASRLETLLSHTGRRRQRPDRLHGGRPYGRVRDQVRDTSSTRSIRRTAGITLNSVRSGRRGHGRQACQTHELRTQQPRHERPLPGEEESICSTSDACACRNPRTPTLQRHAAGT